MFNKVKLIIYRVARVMGLFWLSRLLTRQRLRILAYHGFELRDETQFRSKLFIRADTFAKRLDLLKRRGYRVLPLGQAVEEREQNRAVGNVVVITIDDGYASTLSVAAPLLQARGIPAIVYLTTYHMQTQTPVFDLMVAYMFWKSRQPSAQLSWPAGNSPLQLDLASPAARERAVARLTDEGHLLESEAERMGFARAMATALSLDFDDIVAAQAFRLLTPAEARKLLTLGVEIGLHTHRHRFPIDDLEACHREIEENRTYLAREVGSVAPHFCYPSGVYDARQWPILENAGLASATTCDTGLVRRGDSRFGLRRFLDGEMVSEVEFEAEISGFADLLRGLLGVNRQALGATG